MNIERETLVTKTLKAVHQKLRSRYIFVVSMWNKAIPLCTLLKKRRLKNRKYALFEMSVLSNFDRYENGCGNALFLDPIAINGKGDV